MFSSSCFSYLFNALTKFFWILSFFQPRKIFCTFSKLSAILSSGSNFVMLTPRNAVRLSSNILIDQWREPIKVRGQTRLHKK